MALAMHSAALDADLGTPSGCYDDAVFPTVTACHGAGWRPRQDAGLLSHGGDGLPAALPHLVSRCRRHEVAPASGKRRRPLHTSGDPRNNRGSTLQPVTITLLCRRR